MNRLLSVAVVATLTLAALVSPATAEEMPQAVSAPLVLDRTCSAGQLDINSATAADIRGTLGVNAATAQRIIDAREWLKPADVVSVAGVGTSKSSILRTRFCALPMTDSTAPKNACLVGSTAVDLQTASLSALRGLGLSSATAQSLIAARPLPGELSQVITPVVSGLSLPGSERLLTGGRACVSPAPFTIGRATWDWVSHLGGGVVTASGDDRYSLFVPPEGVEAPGGWGSVTVLPPASGVLPSADFHLTGMQVAPVRVTLPQVDGIDASQQLLIHDASDGTRVSFGDGLTVNPDGTMSADLESLSPVTAGARPICEDLPLLQRRGVFCVTQTAHDMRLDALIEMQFQYWQTYGYIPTPSPCLTTDPLLKTDGQLNGFSCQPATASDGVASFVWENSTGNGVWQGTAMRISSTPSHAVTRRPPSESSLTASLWDVMADGSGAITIPPEGQFAVTTAQGQPSVNVQADASPVSFLFWASGAITSFADVVPGMSTVGSTYACVTELVQDADLEQVATSSALPLLGCVKTISEAAIDAGISSVGTSGRERALLASSKGLLKGIGPAAFALDVGFSSYHWLSTLTPSDTTHEYAAPPESAGYTIANTLTVVLPNNGRWVHSGSGGTFAEGVDDQKDFYSTSGGRFAAFRVNDRCASTVNVAACDASYRTTRPTRTAPTITVGGRTPDSSISLDLYDMSEWISMWGFSETRICVVAGPANFAERSTETNSAWGTYIDTETAAVLRDAIWLR